MCMLCAHNLHTLGLPGVPDAAQMCAPASEWRATAQSQTPTQLGPNMQGNRGDTEPTGGCTLVMGSKLVAATATRWLRRHVNKHSLQSWATTAGPPPLTHCCLQQKAAVQDTWLRHTQVTCTAAPGTGFKPTRTAVRLTASQSPKGHPGAMG